MAMTMSRMIPSLSVSCHLHSGYYGSTYMKDELTMLSARIEMGIEGDTEALRKQTDETYARMQKSVNDLVAAVKPKLAPP